MLLYRRWCTTNALVTPPVVEERNRALRNAIPDKAKFPSFKRNYDEREDRPYIPGPFEEEIDHFGRFLKEACKSEGENGYPMKLFTQSMHHDSLVDWSKGTVDEFVDGMKRVLHNLHILFENGNELDGLISRDDWIHCLEVSVINESVTKKNIGKPNFLASQVVCDVEETIIDACGDGKNVHCGVGGDRGYEFIDTEKLDKAPASATKEEKQSHYCKQILEAMSQDLSEEILDALALYKRDDHRLYNKVNGTAFRIWHLDHCFCILSTVESYSNGNRIQKTANGGFVKLYEWPCPNMWRNFYNASEVLSVPAQEAINRFESYSIECGDGTNARATSEYATVAEGCVPRYGYGPIPNSFKFANEDSVWPKMVKSIPDLRRELAESNPEDIRRAANTHRRHVVAEQNQNKNGKKTKKRGRAKKQPGAPKRKSTALQFYQVATRPSVKPGHKGKSVRQVNLIMESMFASLADKDRERWDDMAEQDKERYSTEMAEFERKQLSEKKDQEDRDDEIEDIDDEKSESEDSDDDDDEKSESEDSDDDDDVSDDGDEYQPPSKKIRTGNAEVSANVHSVETRSRNRSRMSLPLNSTRQIETDRQENQDEHAALNDNSLMDDTVMDNALSGYYVGPGMPPGLVSQAPPNDAGSKYI
ncbi:MAG: hypothetical protein SGARI_000546 [Bacillariaceae sp.]